MTNTNTNTNTNTEREAAIIAKIREMLSSEEMAYTAFGVLNAIQRMPSSDSTVLLAPYDDQDFRAWHSTLSGALADWLAQIDDDPEDAVMVDLHSAVDLLIVERAGQRYYLIASGDMTDLEGILSFEDWYENDWIRAEYELPGGVTCFLTKAEAIEAQSVLA